jgi:hypothetical protein
MSRRITWPTSPTNGRRLDAGTVTTVTVNRLRKIVDTIDHETWKAGMAWYETANAEARALAAKHGVPSDTVAAIIAALSPRCNWANNLDDTRLLLEDGPDNGFFAFDANVGKADAILNAGFDVDTTLGGRKVRAFWRNIADPYGSLDVTLDSWMGRALDVPADRAHGEQSYLDRAGVYDAISNGFRTVADDHGIMPNQLQAAIWLAERKQ